MRIEQVIENGITITLITADNGKRLFDGKIYCQEAKLAPTASVEDWQEVDKSEVPTEQENE